MKRLLAVCAVCAPLLVPAAIRAITLVPQDSDPKSDWMKRHETKLAAIAKGDVGKVVFIGDTMTHLWERPFPMPEWKRWFAEGKYKALNLGFSGDRTEHVLWRLDHGELDGYEAKAVVLMIGTENAGRFSFDKEPPEDTILAIREILRKIAEKQPKAVTLLLPIFPRGAGPDDPIRRRNDVVNKELRHFADGKKVVWIDFTDQFLYPDGTIPIELMPDRQFFGGCNSNDFGAGGFNIWASAIIPWLDRILDRSPDDTAVLPNLYASRATPAMFHNAQPCCAQPDTRFHTYSASRGGDWWGQRLLEKRNQIVDSKGEFDVVLLGDSITHFWESHGGDVYASLTNAYRTLNRGYGGDNTRHLIWRATNGEFEGYRAKAFVLMIGTNNHWDKPAEIAAAIRRILDLIATKHPEAKTVLLPIFPRNLLFKNSDADLREHRRNLEVNGLIAPFADGKRVIWCDFNAKLSDEKGLAKKGLFFDGLHPNRNGYAIWYGEMNPILREACGK